MATTEKIRVFRTGDRVELRALADHLEEQGVEVHTVGESTMGGPYGVVGVDLTSNLEIWTSKSDSRRAGELIADWNRLHHPHQAELQRPIRYSLRALILLMTAVALACAALASFGFQWVPLLLGIFEIGLGLYCVLVYIVGSHSTVRRVRSASPSEKPFSSSSDGKPDDE